MLAHARSIGSQLETLGFFLYNTGYKAWSYRKGNINVEVNYNAWQYSEPFSVCVTDKLSLINPTTDEIYDLLSNSLSTM